MSLPALLASAVRDEASLAATIPSEWMQGRTTYGGISAALALEAVRSGDLPPLRSAQIAFVGPLGGPVHVEAKQLRRGKNSAFIAADVSGEEGVGLRALFLFMASRASAIEHVDLASPSFADPETRPVDPARLPQGFLSNFDLAAAGEPPPGSVRRWARLRDRAGLHPATELVAIADAVPPAAMSLAKEWGPISTTTWQLNLTTDRPGTRDGWWLLEAKTLHARGGGSSQSMTIWNRDGEPVATATQSVALFI